MKIEVELQNSVTVIESKDGEGWEIHLWPNDLVLGRACWITIPFLSKEQADTHAQEIREELKKHDYKVKTTVKLSGLEEELSAEEVRRFSSELSDMTGWRLIEIPNPDWKGGVLVGIVHPHSPEFGYEAHEKDVLRRKSNE